MTLSTTPSSHRALRAFMAGSVSVTVLLSGKATTQTASGREQAGVSTHARAPRGITLQAQSPPGRTGWNYFGSFPPSLLQDSHNFFYFKQFKCS